MSKLQNSLEVQIRRQVSVRHIEADSQPSKKWKKSGGKGSVAFLHESKHLGCVRGYRAAEVEVDFTEKHKIFGIRSHRPLLKRHVTHRKKSGKKGSIARSFSISVNLENAVFELQNLRVQRRKKPCNENDAPAEKHGIWRKVSFSSMKRTRPRSSHLQKFGHQRHFFEET